MANAIRRKVLRRLKAEEEARAAELSVLQVCVWLVCVYVWVWERVCVSVGGGGGGRLRCVYMSILCARER